MYYICNLLSKLSFLKFGPLSTTCYVCTYQNSLVVSDDFLKTYQEYTERKTKKRKKSEKMPTRKSPFSLQVSALRRIGSLFKTTCQNVTEEVIACLDQEYQHLSYAQLKALKTSLLCVPVAQIQKCFFVDTAYFFHERIVIECLVILTYF